MNYDDLLMATYELREKMVADVHRPRYHFCPPQGRWNDLNGMIYWNGRYHAGYLQKIRNGPGQRDFSSQQHISSRDLLHWRYHPAALREPRDATNPW
jgi:beta-fructofuranosidase